ncbi:MAG TPA: DUF885 family protein, partial [Caulobacteraceae bacterium]
PADEAARRPGERTPEGYLVDLADIRARPTWTLPSVAYHELIPGHLLQSQIERRRAPHRMQVRYAPGYSEGWAVYAERLAGDLGLYADDPRGELGMIHWLLFRMARVLADVGVHAFGWTMDEAVRRVRAIQGPAIAFVGIEEDVRRLCLIPGAYAGQGLTYLELAQLRRARAPRRAAWPGFHAAVLSHGPLPPSALRRS